MATNCNKPVCIDINKISTSGEAIFGIIVLLITVWVIIQILIVAIFNEFYFYPGVFLFLGVCIGLVFPCTGKVEMNQSIVLLNSFSKKARAVFHGFYVKLPWEKVAYDVDLESSIEAEVTAETFPTQEGVVLASTSILSKVDSAEGKDEITRSEYLIGHVKNEHKVIKGMLIARARQLMREFFIGKSLDLALKANGSKILDPDISFKELEGLLRISVKECPISDIDPSTQAQNAMDGRMKSDVIHETATKFMKLDPNLGGKEALNFATLLNRDISVEKKIHEFNLTGLESPAIQGLFIALANKLGGNK